MRKLFVLVLALAAAGGGGYVYWTQYRVEEARDHLTLYGNVDLREVALAFNGQEHIARVLVEEGAHVKKGDPLAELEQDRLQLAIEEVTAQIAAQGAVLRKLENGTRPQEIDRARAEVAAVEAQRELAQRTYNRKRGLVETGAVTQLEVDDARAAVDVAAARLNAAQKALDLAVIGPREEDIAQARANLRATKAKRAQLRIQLADTELYAPVDGIIRNRILEPGDWADPRAPVFTLARMDPKWVRVYVPETELGHVKPGMTATVHTDSHPGKAYEGWVGFVSPTAEFTPKNVETIELRSALVYETRVFVRDPENELRLGMPATVQVALDVEVKEKPGFIGSQSNTAALAPRPGKAAAHGR
jgi:HlyD family secretion protein